MDPPYTHIEAQYSHELLVFLFLIVPSMGISFFLVHRGEMGFVLVAIATIFRDLALVGLVAFFLWRNSEQAGRIGWRFENHWRDALLGAVLFSPVSSAIGLLERSLYRIGLSQPSTPLPSFLSAHGLPEVVLATVLVTVVAISEETIFRGYLILGLSAVTHSTVAAVLVSSSSVIFALGHGYEGSASAVSVGVMALSLQSSISRRRLLGPMVMHFLQDFIGIALTPLLHRR